MRPTQLLRQRRKNLLAVVCSLPFEDLRLGATSDPPVEQADTGVDGLRDPLPGVVDHAPHVGQ